MHRSSITPFRIARFWTLTLCTVLCFIFSNCSDDFMKSETNSEASLQPLLELTTTSKASPASCSTCKYVIPENMNIVDGAKLGFKPGDVICISAQKSYSTTPMRFINVVGTATNPIYITNCGGGAKVSVPSNLSYVVKFENSKYFRLTGGDVKGTYGLKFYGANLGVSMEKLSTNFEVDHIEVYNVGFAGIMAKTDPTCEAATWRGNFTLRDSQIHHNYVHDTGGEGLYVGNSFYTNGVTTTCGVKLPHTLVNMKIYSNVVKNAGWEAIQLGCAAQGAEVHDNIVENYGKKNVYAQNNGIQIGEGSGGLCYNNHIKSGPGTGLMILGLGDNIVFNNIIINPGAAGIFCDDRALTGTGFKFINNTIANPKTEGIKIYADKPQLMNIVKNNLISNPGNYNFYQNDNTARTGQDAFIYILSSNVKVSSSNNYNSMSTTLANFLNLGSFNSILGFCPVSNNGANPATYGVTFDFNMKGRPFNGGYDIGALEY